MFKLPNSIQLVILNHPDYEKLINKLVKVSEKASEFYDNHNPDDKDGKKFVGALFSDTLFEDATDNIFYRLAVYKIQDNIKRKYKKSFVVEVTFMHNATLQKISFLVKPTDYYLENEGKQDYLRVTANNCNFSTIYQHLLYGAIEKLANEIPESGDFTALEKVSILYD